jgi:preprotein translocase subunit SecE
MTPKEKAKNLLDKFINLYEGVNLELAKKHWAKQSALIASTEIVNALAFDFENPSEKVIYWLKVKQEIENL